MTYQVSKKQPPKRDAEIAWEQAAPGLYDDGEILVELDGIHATVSIEHEWLENGEGVTFLGTARWCDAEGQTQLCPAGKHVESYISHTVDPTQLALHSFDALKRDVLLTLLGEEPHLTVDDGEGNLVPVLSLSQTTKLNASIRHAAKTVTAMSQSAALAALLS